MQPPIPPPQVAELVTPLLASLPAASISPTPPAALLPLLSPILRQRVQLLSASSSTSQEPWLPLLCWDTSKQSALERAAKNERLEPHPVSGEVEVDWEYDVETRYKRVDAETLQALCTLRDLGLGIKLVYCIGGEDDRQWRIGEVLPSDEASGASWGEKSIGSAEEAYKNSQAGNANLHTTINGSRSNGHLSTVVDDAMDEDDDDDYWAQYDNTPARTPAPKQPSPAPMSMNGYTANPTDETAYYEQYASVQPAMDNHDPDEAPQAAEIETSLGRDEITNELRQHLNTQPEPISTNTSTFHSSALTPPELDSDITLAHPRPGSSTGSSGSDTVAKLERRAARREASEMGVKQHISTSVKSLYRLAKGSGIDRVEFERLVRIELECLGMMDEDD